MSTGPFGNNNLSQVDPGEIKLPIWFLCWLLAQIGGGVVLSDIEVSTAAELYERRQIEFYRDDLGRLTVKIKDE